MTVSSVNGYGGPERHGAPFGALLRACRLLRGQRVAVTVADCRTGLAFASATAVLTDVAVDDDRLELVLGDQQNWLAIFGDMIDAVDVAEDGVSIAYRAGDIVIRRGS